MSKAQKKDDFGFKPNFDLDYYKILGVKPSASHADIISRFRKLKETRSLLTENIIEAYNMLANDLIRERYNKHKKIDVDFTKQVLESPKKTDRTSDSTASTVSSINSNDSDDLFAQERQLSTGYISFQKQPNLSHYDILLISPEGKSPNVLDKEIHDNYNLLHKMFTSDPEISTKLDFAYAQIRTQELRKKYTASVVSRETHPQIQQDKEKHISVISKIKEGNKLLENFAKDEVKQLRSTISKLKLLMSGEEFSKNELKAINIIVRSSGNMEAKDALALSRSTPRSARR